MKSGGVLVGGKGSPPRGRTAECAPVACVTGGKRIKRIGARRSLRDVPRWPGVGRRDRVHVTPPESDGARGGRDQIAGGVVCLYRRCQRQTILPYYRYGRTSR